MSLKSFLAGIGAVAALAFVAAPANAAILVDQVEPYAGHYVGGYDWTQFTASMAAQPKGYVSGSIANAAQVAAADAILVDARSNFAAANALSAAEVANLKSFLATGKRVLIVGDGNFFDIWNNSVLALVSEFTGQTATLGATANGAATPVSGFDLTAGVGTFNMEGAGTVVGGTALFSTNFATQWAPNLITVFDFNAFKDNPSPAFRTNIANWLGAPTAVPEPATWAMMIMGFGLVGAAMRRRATGLKLA